MQRARRIVMAAVALSLVAFMPGVAFAQSGSADAIQTPAAPRAAAPGSLFGQKTRPDAEPESGFRRPTQPTPPTAPSGSIFRSAEEKRGNAPASKAEPATGQTSSDPQTPVAGPNGQPRKTIPSNMNAILRQPGAHAPPPPSYLAPKTGVVINPPSARPAPPIMRLQTQPAMMTANARAVPAPVQSRKARLAAKLNPAPAQAAPPPGFRPTPPRAPAFRPMRSLAQPAPPTAAAQKYECTPERLAKRMCPR